MELIKLSDDQRFYLQVIYDYFHEQGRWPWYRDVKQMLLEVYPDVDVDEVVKSLPTGLSKPYDAYMFGVPGYTNEATFLTVLGVYLCQGSEEDLADFVRAMRFCVERYSSPNKNDRYVSSSDLVYELGMSELAVRKVGQLLEVEAAVFSSFSMSEGSWECRLSRSVRQFREVATIEQYLEKVEMLKKEGKDIGLTSEPTQYSIVVSEMGNLDIHPTLYAKCWGLYTKRQYEEAVLNAIKALEVAVRTKARLPLSLAGADLISKAFDPTRPILRYSEVRAEQEGVMSLLRGIVEVFKTSHRHRFVGVQDKSECLAVLLMCSNLLHVVDKSEFLG